MISTGETNERNMDEEERTRETTLPGRGRVAMRLKMKMIIQCRRRRIGTSFAVIRLFISMFIFEMKFEFRGIWRGEITTIALTSQSRSRRRLFSPGTFEVRLALPMLVDCSRYLLDRPVCSWDDLDDARDSSCRSQSLERADRLSLLFKEKSKGVVGQVRLLIWMNTWRSKINQTGRGRESADGDAH